MQGTISEVVIYTHGLTSGKKWYHYMTAIGWHSVQLLFISLKQVVLKKNSLKLLKFFILHLLLLNKTGTNTPSFEGWVCVATWCTRDGARWRQDPGHNKSAKCSKFLRKGPTIIIMNFTLTNPKRCVSHFSSYHRFCRGFGLLSPYCRGSGPPRRAFPS